MKIAKSGFILLILILGSSCTVTSPVMLEAQITKSTSNALPYTVGVSKITKKGSQQLTKIKTYQTLGIMQMSGRMPRRSEVDYYNKAFTNALRSNSLFSYVYATPFDRNDVDLVIDIEIDNFNISNSSYGTLISHASFVPVVGIFASLGVLINVVPQEYFSGGWGISYHLKNKSGKLIKTYTDEQVFQDYVGMWEQPFASYSWYESAWIKLFNDSLNRIQSEIRKDSELIRNNIN
jgi:hypothetical protein